MVEKTLKKECPIKNQNKFMKIYDRYKTFTMIPQDIYLANLELAYRFSGLKGAVVECGTWKGGMIAGIAHLLGSAREYWLFDSFEGLPPAKGNDGEDAKRWQADKGSPNYFDNCSASEKEAKKVMEYAGINNAKIKKGWFKTTLPQANFPEGIDILRMDADWYESTMEILTYLFPHVNNGGCLIIDDYYQWDGCSKAVHDFLSKNERIERIDAHKGVCFIVKSNDEWNNRINLVKQDIATVISSGDSFIFVDDSQLGMEVTERYHAKQFIERDSYYWGPPPDDETAIKEFNRLRTSGANYIVFAWPVFWYFEHYSEWYEYLCSNFPCILENDRIVIFDLRKKKRG